ncbi:MAG TPA: thiolase family protein [Pseudomonadales bacterium]|nr:thiolase family protein [Pseudomonadales bacterium]
MNRRRTLKLNPNDVVIASAKRTPIAAMQGAFSSLTATELGSHAIAAAISESGISMDEIDEVLMGNVLSAGLGQAPARQAALGAGINEHTPCTTVSKVCGSGMRSIMLGVDQLKLGHAKAVVTGGMESMTNAPYFLAKARGGFRLGHGEIKDHMFFDGLEDAYTGKAMGHFAQLTADAQKISRGAMDEYAVRSLQRAQFAINEGYFKEEIQPIQIKTRQGEILIDEDEQPAKASVVKIPTLKPVFSQDGTITAANASSISDGAAALVLTTAQYAHDRGLTPLALVLGHTSHAQHPSEFTTAPIGAIQKLLAKIAWDVSVVDLWEINEAFAMVTMMTMEHFNLDIEKVNVNGGACALGHPIGASGARIVVTLLHALRLRGLKRGVASLCIGGGEGTALAIEIL